MRILVLCHLLGFLLLPAYAQWSGDPAVNNPICTVANASASPTFPRTTSDGAGGAIITWADFRNDTLPTPNPDIYAQRISVSGTVQWTTNGVGICNMPFFQAVHSIISDGAGGAIIPWSDARGGTVDSYDIYAQRVNASGTAQWAPNGLIICNAPLQQGSATLVSDGAGGAIVTWEDFRGGGNTRDIYAQRINASGAVQWATNGMAICTTNTVSSPRIVGDGAGGAIITWSDFRTATSTDIYAQRVNASGAVQWTIDGVAICTAANNQGAPGIVSDSAGGAIITWEDNRGPGLTDIYAQRINASGVVQWTAGGVAISTAAIQQLVPTIASDGAGGAIIAWEDNRLTGVFDIYAQRVNSSGTAQWMANGVAICSAANNQIFATIVSVGPGDAIITWEDRRNGTGNSDIYAQRINASGVAQWAANGVAISTAANNQYRAAMVSNNAGGAIVSWADVRDGSEDIYASRVNQNGTLTAVKDVGGEKPIGFVLEQNYPNPFNPATTIRFELPRSSHVCLRVFDPLGRKVATLLDSQINPGTHDVDWNASNISSGVYFYRLEAGEYTETRKLIILR